MVLDQPGQPVARVMHRPAGLPGIGARLLPGGAAGLLRPSRRVLHGAARRAHRLAGFLASIGVAGGFRRVGPGSAGGGGARGNARHLLAHLARQRAGALPGAVQRARDALAEAAAAAGHRHDHPADADAEQRQRYRVTAQGLAEPAGLAAHGVLQHVHTPFQDLARRQLALELVEDRAELGARFADILLDLVGRLAARVIARGGPAGVGPALGTGGGRLLGEGGACLGGGGRRPGGGGRPGWGGGWWWGGRRAPPPEAPPANARTGAVAGHRLAARAIAGAIA